MEIRTKMATTMMDESKKGTMAHCDPRQDTATRANYCNNIMVDDGDFEKKKDCLGDPTDFCYSCCENEFGRLMGEDRTKC
jgi:hypothetical protein